MSSSIARAVVAAFAHALRPPSNVDATLSGRESEILERLGSGMRYKEIADALNLSVHTVRTHLHNIYRKLQVNSKGEALQILREGRVGPEGAAPGFNPFRRRML